VVGATAADGVGVTLGSTVGSGVGGGVRRGLGDADTSGDGVGVADALGAGVADGVAVALGVGAGVGAGVAVGAAVGAAVGSGAGDAEGSAVTTGDGVTDGATVAAGEWVTACVGRTVTTGVWLTWGTGDAVGSCEGTLVMSGVFVGVTAFVAGTDVPAGPVELPVNGLAVGAAERVVSVGATVGVATGVTIPPPVCGGGGAMIAEAAKTNAPPISATVTTVTIRVPVVRIAPRSTWRGRLASHERLSSRRRRSAMTAVRMRASNSGDAVGSGRLRSSSSSRVDPPSSAAHAGQPRT